VDLRNRLRQFLTSSNHYKPLLVVHFIKPIKQFLSKENAIVKMKIGCFKEAFQICIHEVKDLHFA